MAFLFHLGSPPEDMLHPACGVKGARLNAHTVRRALLFLFRVYAPSGDKKKPTVTMISQVTVGVLLQLF